MEQIYGRNANIKLSFICDSFWLQGIAFTHPAFANTVGRVGGGIQRDIGLRSRVLTGMAADCSASLWLELEGIVSKRCLWGLWRQLSRWPSVEG